jgi:hypothetical protein
MPKKRQCPLPERLREFYTKEHQTAIEIVTSFADIGVVCGTWTVYKWLKELGIPIRSQKEAARLALGRELPISGGILSDWHHVERLSLRTRTIGKYSLREKSGDYLL